MTPQDIRIVDAAEEWNRARKDAIRLRTLRASLGCDPEPGVNGEPCWKRTKAFDPEEDRAEKYPVSTWCEKCQARETAHLDYRAAMKRRGIAIRRLQALLARRTA